MSQEHRLCNGHSVYAVSQLVHGGTLRRGRRRERRRRFENRSVVTQVLSTISLTADDFCIVKGMYHLLLSAETLPFDPPCYSTTTGSRVISRQSQPDRTTKRVEALTEIANTCSHDQITPSWLLLATCSMCRLMTPTGPIGIQWQRNQS